MNADLKYYTAKNQKQVAANLRAARVAAGMSNNEASHIGGIHSTALSKWELQRQRLWGSEVTTGLTKIYTHFKLAPPEWVEVDTSAYLSKAHRRRHRRRAEDAAQEGLEATPTQARRSVTTTPEVADIDDEALGAMLLLYKRGFLDQSVLISAMKRGRP